MVQQRDVNNTKFFYNTDTLGADELQKATEAPIGGMIGLPAAAFGDPGGPIRALPHGPYARENFQFNDYIDADLSRTHAIDATSSGTTESSVTATEAQLRQANVNVRLGWEQGFVADWFVQGATKYATLMQRFLPTEEAAAIVGDQAAAAWEAWRRTSASRLAFTMAPDSSLRNDTPLERKQLQDLYTYLANDPGMNRAYLREKLLLKYHLDPAKAVLPPDQVPKPTPQPPVLSLSFKGEDLNPLSPQSPVVLDILSKLGVQIDPQAITNALQLGALAMAQQQQVAAAEAAATGPDGAPPHGGKVAPMESLDKHNADLTGGMQGSGQMAAGLAGGMGGG
jgi:hypothetical protein